MKKIGIIGAGQIGSTLAKKWGSLGHQVKISNSRGPESLTDIGEEINVEPVTVAQAVLDVDVVVIAIPVKNIVDLPTSLFENSQEKTIIVDTGNYYPEYRDLKINEVEGGMPESQWVSEYFGRPVIKAFNNIFAASLSDLGKPSNDPERIALPVAGNSKSDKDEIIDLIDQLGFDGIDGGLLSESWRQQPGSPVYCTDYQKKDVQILLNKADKSRLSELRALSLKKFSELSNPAVEGRSMLRSLFLK